MTRLGSRRPWLAGWLLATVGLASAPAAATWPEDPFRSPLWAYNLERYLGPEAKLRLSDRVVVKVPPFAEDATQVPFTLDLSGFDAPVEEVIAWVDLNPIPHFFSFRPEAAGVRTLALNCRIQQASTVRAAVRAAIEALTDRPITHVVLSHHHPDHVFGNQAFDPDTLHALEGTIARLAAEGEDFADNLYRALGDWMRGTEVVLPTRVVTPGRLTLGGHDLERIEMTGHSGADLVLMDHTSGVLLAADLVFYNRAPTTPHTPGLEVWREELRRLEAIPYRFLVPGHGPVVEDRAPFAQRHDYLDWLDTTLRESARRGLTASEVMALPIPERFAAVTVARYELIRSVTHLYPRYELAALAGADNGE